MRFAAGVTLLVFLLAIEKALSPSLWLEPVITLTFLGGWLALMAKEVRATLVLIGRRA